MPKEKLFNENAVLQNATELFWNKGYNGTSMDELTKVTGLSRSSIYNTFEDKHNLFIKCINFYQEQQQQELLKAVQKTSSPIKKIQLAFKHLIEKTLKDEHRKGCLVVNTTTELANIDEEISKLVLKNMGDMKMQFEEWIKAAQEQGEISNSFSPQALSSHLFNTFSGLRIISQTTPDRKTLENIVKVALSVLK